jgi:hypothetical protein
MVRKIGRQMAVFYSALCPAYDRSKNISLSDSYRLTSPSLNASTYPEVWRNYPPAVEWVTQAEVLGGRAVVIEQPRVLRKALTFLAGAYLPLLGISCALALSALFWCHGRAHFGWLAGLTVFVFLFNTAACLEVAIVNSLDVWRYCTVQFYFTLLAEFLAVRLLWEAVFVAIAELRTPGRR